MGRKPLGKSRCKWKDTTKIHPSGAVWIDMYCIHLARDGVEWRALMGKMSNIRVSYESHNCLVERLSVSLNDWVHIDCMRYRELVFLWKRSRFVEGLFQRLCSFAQNIHDNGIISVRHNNRTRSLPPMKKRHRARVCEFSELSVYWRKFPLQTTDTSPQPIGHAAHVLSSASLFIQF
jgi:hypothetical protein